MKKNLLLDSGFIHRTFTILICCLTVIMLLQSCSLGVELDNSGELLIEDSKAGTGDMVPFSRDSVVQLSVKYTAKRSDGTSFASSNANAVNLVMGADLLIEGVEIGLRGMKVGGVRKLTIPPRLGFGISTQAPVPPNTTVIYEFELLGIQRLVIEDIVLGTGDEAVIGKSLSVLYIGRLTNGTIFDSNQSMTTPFRFALGARQVILGWDLGLRGMRVGGKRKLTIPSELGYGAQGGGNGKIPANATLVFEVELLSLN